VIDGDVHRVFVRHGLIERDDWNLAALGFGNHAVQRGRRIRVDHDRAGFLADHVAHVLNLLAGIRARLLDDEVRGEALGLIGLELFLGAVDHLVAPFGAEITVR
jgi:hypothetical protein